MEMTQKDLDEWVQALTSGAVTQVTGALHKQGMGMCCLGVLTCLNKERLGVEETVTEDGLIGYGGATMVLPLTLSMRFNSGDISPEIPMEVLTEEEKLLLRYRIHKVQGKYVIHAAGLNDGGIPFKRIAELLPYGIDIIDDYETRNVVRPRKIPGSN